MTRLMIGFELDGYHYWPNPPEKYHEFETKHRHMFKFVCWLEVRDSDDPAQREVELWELRRTTCAVILKSFGHEGPVDFGPMSCEGIAKWLKSTCGFSQVFVGEEHTLGALVD